MASKRSASSDLNHDNWDQEDEPEEAGTFNKASEDVLRKRVFKTAKRRMPKSSEEGSLNVFNPVNLAKFSNTTTQPASQLFGFLSKVQSDVTKTNGVSEKSDDKDVDKCKVTSTFMFGNNTSKQEVKTSSNIFGNNSGLKQETVGNISMFNTGSFNSLKEKEKIPVSTSSTFTFGSQNIAKADSKPSENFSFGNKVNSKSDGSEKSGSLDNYYAKLKGLNQSVAKWINTHVETNPLINLQPIFKDYEQFFEEIEKNKKQDAPEPEKKETVLIGTKPQNSEEKPVSIFGSVPKPVENKVESTPLAASFKFGVPSSNTSSTIQSEKPQFTFGTGKLPTAGGFSFGIPSSAPINFGSVSSTPVSNEDQKDEDESDEPPKVEIKQVEEEGHIYTIRCKLFIKKDGNFVEKGLGSLFLKPVPESEKVQLIVRAHNSLANVLCNFILSEGIPIQRMGKNNVMVVCIPTPESQPPPVPVLIKVKTGEDADELIKTLEKHKK